MKPAFLIAAAVVAIISVAAIAYAAATSGGDGNEAAQAPSPTPTAPTPSQPSATPTPGVQAPSPAAPGGGDTPATSEPQPTVGPNTPIPSEPIFTVTPPEPQATLPPGRYPEAAPIDGLDVRIAESFPPQYFVTIQAGLPSGCAEPYMHNVTRNGNVIEIEVLNSFPEGSPICTAIYGMYEINIALGSDFTSGATYTVSVNGGAAEETFVAQ